MQRSSPTVVFILLRCRVNTSFVGICHGLPRPRLIARPSTPRGHSHLFALTYYVFFTTSKRSTFTCCLAIPSTTTNARGKYEVVFIHCILFDTKSFITIQHPHVRQIIYCFVQADSIITSRRIQVIDRCI